MNREEATLLGFEIVAYAGEARSYLLEALNAAEKGDYDKELFGGDLSLVGLECFCSAGSGVDAY